MTQRRYAQIAATGRYIPARVVTGYLVTMTAAAPGWVWVAAGFLLFRLFDILKPWPIRSVDRQVAGGMGIMLDDVLAGVYAGLCLYGLAFLAA